MIKYRKEEAEEIALEDAKSDGYISATLWKEFDDKTRLVYVYSTKYNKDMKTWKVQLDTDEQSHDIYLPALTYFISVDNGEVIAISNALENTEKIK
ncbi:hypothetical protein [Lysinibacillus telephonicus]|uniref:hypothetical protein n=1 Tax=Lysinibacillus telephonicus TaxID=1714840 RepID=UPI000F82975A|nr:hypothetical protein [Lysinibacillus telephonicus]